MVNMTEQEWNDWTEEVREYIANLDDVKEHFTGTEKQWKRWTRNLVEAIEEGDDDEEYRVKDVVQKMGKRLPMWPKTRGKGTTFSAWANMMFDHYVGLRAEAWMAFYNVLEQHGIAHHEMTRASRKNGTEGQPYGNLENFLKARGVSDRASIKGDFKNGLWGSFETDINAPQPEGSVGEWILAPISRPVPTDDNNNAAVEEDSEDSE